jgi:four helix bundle protein
VVEEADETQFWMELLVESGIIPAVRLSDLMNEGEEILKIMSSSRRTCKQKLNSKNDNHS